MPFDPEPSDESEYGTTRRKLVLKAVLDLCRQVREGRWTVRRGSRNWASWPFDDHPFGLTVHADESSFLRTDKNEMAVTLEMMARMPEGADEVDDDLLDDMLDDAAWVFRKLDESRDPDDPGMPVITRLDVTRDNATEVGSADLRVQGLMATAFVEY